MNKRIKRNKEVLMRKRLLEIDELTQQWRNLNDIKTELENIDKLSNGSNDKVKVILPIVLSAIKELNVSFYIRKELKTNSIRKPSELSLDELEAIIFAEDKALDLILKVTELSTEINIENEEDKTLKTSEGLNNEEN